LNNLGSTAVCPEDWALEINQLNCDTAWVGVSMGMDIDDEYYLRNKDPLTKQLAIGGIRLATILNEIWD